MAFSPAARRMQFPTRRTRYSLPREPMARSISPMARSIPKCRSRMQYDAHGLQQAGGIGRREITPNQIDKKTHEKRGDLRQQGEDAFRRCSPNRRRGRRRSPLQSSRLRRCSRWRWDGKHHAAKAISIRQWFALPRARKIEIRQSGQRDARCPVVALEDLAEPVGQMSASNSPPSHPMRRRSDRHERAVRCGGRGGCD